MKFKELFSTEHWAGPSKKQFKSDLTDLKDVGVDYVTGILDNFWGILIGHIFLIGGLWLAISVSTN